jgi:hypothetical protein
MKAVFALLLVSAFAHVDTRPVERVSLEEISKRVESFNFEVLAEANRVYQAKQAIHVARGELLPKLNVWRLAGAVLDPLKLIELVQDIAPFLIPANWFRVEEQKLLHLAQREGHRALFMNELFTARALFHQVALDEALWQEMLKASKEHETLFEVARVRAQMGDISREAAQELEIRLLQVREDVRTLGELVARERTQLSLAMGYPGRTQLELVAPAYKDPQTAKPLDYDQFEFRVMDAAPERRQIDWLVKAADWVRREAVFSFLGSSSLSRGVGGGIFDDLPVQDGLGFGLGPSLKIVKGKKELLKLQGAGVEEVLKRQLDVTLLGHDLAMKNAPGIREQIRLSEQVLAAQMRRLSLGERVDLMDLADKTRLVLESRAKWAVLLSRFAIHEEQLSRLTLNTVYSKVPAEWEEVRE